MENQYSARNYDPLPIVFSKAKGCCVTDPEGRKYFDMLSSYGAVSQGHLNPVVVKALEKQLKRCTLSSRAFYNDQFPCFAKELCQLFGYEQMLPMNTGAEAVETAVKLARKWGYKVKGIPANKAIIICMDGNFHGRTITCVSMSSEPSAYQHYGPRTPGFCRVQYGSLDALKCKIQKYGERVCGIVVEPIQGENGVIIPPDGYLKGIATLCKKHRILFIDDEVQSGLGRTGKLLAVDHEKGVRPDIVVLAKSLGGGLLPISAVLADSCVMNTMEPGTHGSTFGGNALASAVGRASLKVIVKWRLAHKSKVQGARFLKFLLRCCKRYPKGVKDARGRGLFCALELKTHPFAVALQMRLRERGVACKLTKGRILRLAPPLTITSRQLDQCCRRLECSLNDLTKRK